MFEFFFDELKRHFFFFFSQFQMTKMYIFIHKSDKNRRNVKIDTPDSLTFLYLYEAWNVAQLVERRTGTPLMQVRFPGQVRQVIFFSAFPVRDRKH